MHVEIEMKYKGAHRKIQNDAHPNRYMYMYTGSLPEVHQETFERNYIILCCLLVYEGKTSCPSNPAIQDSAFVALKQNIVVACT